MRRFRSEFIHNYNTYSFGYCEYAEIVDPSDLESVYDSGFLPYSGLPAPGRPTFYLARSLRVEPAHLIVNKKRRYHERQITDVGVDLGVKQFTDLSESEIEEMFNRSLDWVEARFNPPYMTPERLEMVINFPFLSHVAIASDGSGDVGYILMCANEQFVHYWFAFYDWERYEKLSLGKWLISQVISWCEATDRKHLYLGTCYGSASAYKIQGFEEGVEWFDGNHWIDDCDLLEYLHERDDSIGRQDRDLFKVALMEDAEEGD